ncbi:MAG: ribosome small subunit-dependent GTPase A [Oscillospiraceae bacterium]|nr:ribosome small subunit-dependent GTPase A [Oscillospiraceae bacterium]
METKTGRIVKALSGFYYVDTGSGIYQCRARGIFRKGNISPLVGDIASITVTGTGEGVVYSLAERKNSFIRPAVANVDAIVMFVSAVNPVTEPFLIDRVSAIACSKGADVIICINKSDMDRGDIFREIYEKTPFTLINTSAVTGQGIEQLMAATEGKFCALTGNSGVGKSSVLNAACPALDLKTGGVSDKLGRGRHTTRHVEMFSLENGAYIIDTPGFSAFDASAADLWLAKDIQHNFPEFAEHIPNCRFTGCNHTGEKGCAVKEALEEGLIHPSRYRSYLRLYEEYEKIQPWELKKQ